MAKQNQTTRFTPSHTVRAFLKVFDVKCGRMQKLNAVITRLEMFLGRIALLKDLGDSTFVAFSEWLDAASNLRRPTRHSCRENLLQIARRAAELNLIKPLTVELQHRGKTADSQVGDDASRYGLLRYFDDVYLIDRQAGDTPLKPETVKSYRSAVHLFLRFAPGVKSALSRINSAKVRAFRTWLVDAGMNTKKAGNHAFAVAAIVKHGKPERFIEDAEELSPAVDPTRTLAYVFENNYLPAKQGIASEKTVAKYLATFNSFGRFLGNIATLGDLTDEKIGGFMRACRAKGNAARSVNGYRSKLLAFWTWCAKRRLVHDFPTVEKMPEPMIIPTSRTLDDLKKLMYGCSRMPGMVANIPAAQWWRMLHVIDWDTMGERTGALLDIRWEWLDWETGYLSIPADYRKGGKKPNLCKLKPATMRELAAFREPQRLLMFPWDKHSTVFYHHYKRLLKLAGLPYVKYKSAIQMHRRSFATHLEMGGGDATAALRHSERSITTDSYIDPKLLDRAPANEGLFSLAEI
jgi:integrase